MSDMQVMMLAAISIGFLHTLTGPDHYIPFIALAKARDWSLGRTLMWTTICGAGHVLSSVVLAFGGAALGWSLTKIGWLEEIRGGWAAWGLLVFGLIYTIWGFINAYKNRPHKHFDLEDTGDIYVYEHKHGQVVAGKDRTKVTPWVMFIIFLLGPCEPMIPLLYYPAAQNSWTGMVVLILLYTAITLATMITIVVLGYYGFSFFKTEKLERYMHAIGGVTILICGIGMVFMGW
jgi:hypothetical protein